MGGGEVSYRVAVIGGSGYIGGAIAKELSGEYDVWIVDLVEPWWDFRDYRASFVKCDIRVFERVLECLKNVDLVVHTAIVQIPRINEERRLGYEVNVLGTQNVCEAVYRSPRAKGLILTGSWHVFGESGLEGVLDEGFGYRPDRVEDRARLYALSKVIQEAVVRYYDEMGGEKVFGVVRLGTVLGEGMPKGTAASIFIEKGLRGEPLTPFKHSMYRPMLYVDVNDVAKAFRIYARRILDGEVDKSGGSLRRVLNLMYPEPVTVLELAEMVRDVVAELTGGRVVPRIEVVDQGLPSLFDPDAKRRFKVDVSRTLSFLGLDRLTSPRESIERIAKWKLNLTQ
jgi:UDP-glucose 4-epimerase